MFLKCYILALVFVQDEHCAYNYIFLFNVCFTVLKIWGVKTVIIQNSKF